MLRPRINRPAGAHPWQPASTVARWRDTLLKMSCISTFHARPSRRTTCPRPGDHDDDFEDAFGRSGKRPRRAEMSSPGAVRLAAGWRSAFFADFPVRLAHHRVDYGLSVGAQQETELIKWMMML